MEALTKWIGCKVKFLDGILPLVPGDIARYFEPFVGGGSLYMGVHDCERFIINDDCAELVELYREAQHPSKLFISHLKDLNASWRNLTMVFRENAAQLTKIYDDFPEGKNFPYMDYVYAMNAAIRKAVPYSRVFLQQYTGEDAFEMEKRFQFTRMKARSKDRIFKTREALEDYILTALKMALYSYYCELYNGRNTLPADLKKAILVFLLHFSSNGQFVFDRQKEFRPAYAGPQHNGKTLDSKILLLGKDNFKERMNKTEIHSLDFREFLRKRRPQAEDFIMVDPPLGEMCRKVGTKTFRDEDMADLLLALKRSKARWMFLAKTADLTPAIWQFADGYFRTEYGPHQELTIITNYDTKNF